MDPYVQHFLQQMNTNPFSSGNILPGGMDAGGWVNYFLSRNPYSLSEMKNPKLRNGQVGGNRKGTTSTGAGTAKANASAGPSANNIKNTTTIASDPWTPPANPSVSSAELDASLSDLQTWYNGWSQNPTQNKGIMKTPVAAIQKPVGQLYGQLKNVETSFNAAEYAKKFLGTPYLWGGNADSTRGYDCAGFVQKVMQDISGTPFAGPGALEAQYDSGGHPSKSELIPGDLVFFQGTYKQGLSHVGIYLGKNQFIHAPKENDVVKISSLDEPYWVEHYYHATRPDVYSNVDPVNSGGGGDLTPEEEQYIQAGANPDPGYQAPAPEPYVPYMEELPYVPYVPEEPYIDPNDVPVGGW
jgi:cell wall-associated NlpC family hydrolase